MKKSIVLNRVISVLMVGYIICPLFGQIDTQVLKKQWISVDNRYTPKSDGRYIKEANILKFYDSHAEGYFVWDDSISTFSYEVNDSLIFCNDTLEYGKILFLSNDSLMILLGQGKMIATYIPIEHIGSGISKQILDTILTKKAWSRIYPYGELKIDFWDIDASSPMVKYCNVIVENEYDFYQEGGYWSTFVYKGNSFLYLSIIAPTLIYGPEIFHVIELDSSVIKTQSFSIKESDSVSFIAIENLSSSEYARFERIFTSRQWQIDSLQETKWPDEEIIPIVRQRKDWLLKDDFLLKDFKYSFSDNIYSISSDSILLSEGTWSLSRDGQFMYLYNDKSGSNLIKILKFDDNEMTIRQKIALKVSRDNDGIRIYDFIIKLN